MIRHLVLVLLIALGTGTLTRVVHADVSATLGDSLAGDAKASYEVGRTLYRASDYAGALVQFQRAYSLSPDARLLWNMAACEKGLHHYAKVLGLVDRYLGSGAFLSEADRKEANAFRDAVRALVSDVTVDVSEPGATVFVDDEQIGTAPLGSPVRLDAGIHRVRATKAGFKERISSEQIPGGVPARVTLVLVRDVRPRLTISAHDQESISLDGQPVGVGEWSGPVSTGAHEIVVSAQGKKSRSVSVSLREDEPRTMNVGLERERTTWPWFVGGAAVVACGAAIAGYFLLRPSSPAPPATSGNAGSFQLP